MKSRVTIAVDEDNQPIIKVEYKESDDVRDELVKKFLESFGSNSTLAQFNYTSGPADGEATAKIRPIFPADYAEIVT